MNQFLGKYVISPIDGQEYCRKNGQFLKHIESHGYNYQTLFEHFNPTAIQYCACTQKCLFDIRKMIYKQTCGNKECANNIMRDKRSSRTEQEWDAWRKKYRDTMKGKTNEELAQIYATRSSTGHTRGTFKASVKQREETCDKRYGNKKYNNAGQISATKLAWDQSRVDLFKARLKASLDGKSLNDFHTTEMFIARRKMLEERGDIIPLDRLTEWERYSKRARQLTEITYRAHSSQINPTNLLRTVGLYELDHIVPVYYGFLNDIPVDMIASVENLQMLTMHENRSKGKNYDPTNSTKHKELEDTNG